MAANGGNGNGSTGGTASSGDAGEVRDALDSFAAAAVKWSSAPTADPKVASAFSLGWHIAQAQLWARTLQPPRDDLGLDAEPRWAVLVGQIEGAHAQLTQGAASGDTSEALPSAEGGDPAASGGEDEAPSAADPGADPAAVPADPGADEAPPAADSGAAAAAASRPDPAAGEAPLTATPAGGAPPQPSPPDGGGSGAPPSLDAGPPPATTTAAVESIGASMLKDLYIADSVLGKAFRLGLELHEMCATPTTAGEAAAALAAREEGVRRLLANLASKLPANAGHTVLNSVSLWNDQIPKPASPPSGAATLPSASPPGATAPAPDHVSDCFRRQGFVWYSVLAGEVAAKDLLRLSDYVGTAEQMLVRLREVAWRSFQWRLAPWVVLGIVVVLTAVGLALILGVSGAGGVTAGAASLIAAFGLTWKGIGEFFGRAAAKAEQALWDAQVDWTLAYRCTLMLDPPPARETVRENRTADHVKTWKRWQQQWPDLSGEPRSAEEVADGG
jgi:hypothetical protein